MRQISIGWPRKASGGVGWCLRKWRRIGVGWRHKASDDSTCIGGVDGVVKHEHYAYVRIYDSVIYIYTIYIYNFKYHILYICIHIHNRS